MSREFEYILWLLFKFVTFFFFLPSLEKTFCKNKRKKKKIKCNHVYHNISNPGLKLPCRNRIHSIQRRVSKPFDRPRQVKKKKKIQFTSCPDWRGWGREERKEEKRRDFFSCEFFYSRTSRFILDKGEAPFGIISWRGPWLRETPSSSRRSRCCARQIRRMVTNRRERPVPFDSISGFFFDETDSLRSSSSSSSCDDPSAHLRARLTIEWSMVVGEEASDLKSLRNYLIESI